MRSSPSVVRAARFRRTASEQPFVPTPVSIGFMTPTEYLPLARVAANAAVTTVFPTPVSVAVINTPLREFLLPIIDHSAPFTSTRPEALGYGKNAYLQSSLAPCPLPRTVGYHNSRSARTHPAVPQDGPPFWPLP